jgi:hypothetical protein
MRTLTLTSPDGSIASILSLAASRSPLRRCQLIAIRDSGDATATQVRAVVGPCPDRFPHASGASHA